MKVYLSGLAALKLENLMHYLRETWGNRVKSDFLKKLSAKIRQISTQPESCPKSHTFQGIFKCVVSKQTTLYYRIVENKEIEIITIFDTRQHPDTLNKELDL